MRISAASPCDLDAACAVIAACRSALEAQGLLQWDAQYPGRCFFRAAIAAGNLFALFDEKEIRGVSVLDRNQPPEWSSADWVCRNESFMVIHAFAISPAMQGRSHGKYLLAFCEEVARKRGCSSIRIDAFSENSHALKFWERNGYSFRGEIRFASKPAGHQRYFCYEKSLSPDQHDHASSSPPQQQQRRSAQHLACSRQAECSHDDRGDHGRNDQR